MKLLKMFKVCFSGSVVTIWEVIFLILNNHTQLTTSLFGWPKNNFGEIVHSFGEKAIEFGDF